MFLRRSSASALFGLPLALLVGIPCATPPRARPPARRPSNGSAPCGSLAPASCARARALVVAASTYADENHDYILRSARIPLGTALAQTHEGWRRRPLACAHPRASAAQLAPSTVDYAFVGVTVDSTLVSADAEISALLARPDPPLHEVGLVAFALVRDRASASLERGEDLVERPSGDCVCGDATHVSAATRYGASLTYAFQSPPRDARARAIDVVRAALDDPRIPVRESRAGSLTIDGLERFLRGEPAVPLAFRVTDPVAVAEEVAPVGDVCDFAAPELSPSPLDFGVAPYGTEARRSVHAVNRSPVDLRALIGAETFLVPAHGAVDLPLRWTPDGDAPGCETQTRDEAIPFARVAGGNPRSARVLETIRTGRATVERAERVELTRDPRAPGSTVRDWTCPRDFVRASCRAASVEPAGDVLVEPRGKDACHFECRGAGEAGRVRSCRFDATMSCALSCGL